MIIVFRENQIWVDALSLEHFSLWNILQKRDRFMDCTSWKMQILYECPPIYFVTAAYSMYYICFDLLSALFYCIIPRDWPVTMKKSLMLEMVLFLINREGDSEWKSLSKRIQTSMFFCGCDSWVRNCHDVQPYFLWIKHK